MLNSLILLNYYRQHCMQCYRNGDHRCPVDSHSSGGTLRFVFTLLDWYWHQKAGIKGAMPLCIELADKGAVLL